MNSSTIHIKIANKIQGRSHIMIAFSGGLDSTVLLHSLVQLRMHITPYLQLYAVHVHHGISRYADLWVDHCELVCRKLLVTLKILRVNIISKHIGIEAASRNARYGAIASIISSQETLVTAQHLDDQCETFLLALKRGSGPTGLSAMASHMPFYNTEQIRPLLDISREQLEQYAMYYDLKWVEDDSNKDKRFDRNFLRLKVLPNLCYRWPHFTKAVARSASLCAEQEQLLDELLLSSLQSLMSKDNSLSINGLLSISTAKRSALLRRWIAHFQVMMPTREQLQKIWVEVAMAKKDANPIFQLGKKQIRRYRQHLYLLPLLSSLKEKIIFWHSGVFLQLPDGLGNLQLDNQKRGICIRAPKYNEVVSLRFTARGKIHLIDRPRSQTIKKIWQEYNIPPWKRDRIPMIYYNETLIAALGIFITQDGQGINGESLWNIYWKKMCTNISNK
ncbi:tRNA lysidine(34) synthetase TilS [Candidatus Profftia sp. (ex Adelges kitamiensis)]|uniref:tRNA lysidine(34) synthetase TilS n=1 Tax=Candidatus Profftia sp. (ex Adelges kitamiensis) TaxID=2864218 RepID=UPI001CE39833|nr:tRNA lysidine(34) synthetase TilS [Candidatus Profftia sp. (ex Adelges kitamiensis)]